MIADTRIPATRTIHPKILYFGTPVVLLTTVNEDGTSNITPMSSAWALTDRIILGLGEGGKGLLNLSRDPDCVINLPSADLWHQVEALAPLTGVNPVPTSKAAQFHFARDKFAAAGLTPLASDCVRSARIAQCPIQIEASVQSIQMTGDPVRFAIVETLVHRVHVHEGLAQSDEHVNPARWNPLIYSFRHYFGLGCELGKTFRAQV
ncbi:MAG: flavin reductase family protein [Firmicutes bacterium]|nr:flavin reductase family protein [Bacillota bacterium]